MEENMVSCSQLKFSKRCWLLARISKEEGEVERFQMTTTQVTTTPSKRRRRKTKYIQEEQAKQKERKESL
jgi:hypothetical protein